MQNLLKAAGAKFLIGYVLLYAAALWYLSRQPSFELSEALGVLVVVGILLSSLALLFTRKAEPMPLPVKSAGRELAVLLLWLAPISAYLVWGAGALRSAVPNEPAQSVVIALVKLALLVAMPAAILMRAWGYRMGELASVGMRWKQLKPALWMSLAVLVMQGVVGRGLRDLGQAQVPGWLAAIAAPLAFAWLLIEVGLVEEFFFRVLLQTRLARLCGSELGGILAASALFGLVHAPGLYLRTSTTLEALGPSPSLATALAYSLVVTSVAGIFLGVLWARTRNFAVLVIVHAAADLIPNLLPFIKAWHLH
jgi:membrane protease YdiL (CAAX protease family)